MINDISNSALITINSLIDYGQTEIRDNFDVIKGVYNGQMNKWSKRAQKDAQIKMDYFKLWFDRIFNLLYELNLEVESDMIRKSAKNLEIYSDQYYLTEIIATLSSIKVKLQNEKQVDININKMKSNNSKVFIVHGHNNELVAETKAFLRQLGLEPIVLRDQVNMGQTIIEKIESYSDVAFGIVLYTKCDRGGLIDENSELKPRARQNVVFEHGYLCAKLKRENVLPLLEEGVEFPGDLSGIVYTVIDKAEAWKTKAAKEMKAAGLDVNLNDL